VRPQGESVAENVHRPQWYARPVKQRLAALLGGVLALVAAASVAQASGGVALVRPDPALEEAVGVALTPWAIDIIRSTSESPGSSMPAAAGRARAIAEDVGAGAVVWISNDDGPALWVYDLESHRVVARRLPSPPPFDDASAAAAALSIKTLLRHSAVAPVEERYAAGLVRQRQRHPRVRYESIAVARLRNTEADDVEPRLGIGISWWPAALGDRVGAAMTAQSGPGIAIDEADLVGRFSDTSYGVSIRGRLALGGRFRVSPELGASLHSTTLDGAVISRDHRAHVSRANVSVDAAAGAQLRIAADVHLALRLGGSYLLRNQRYLVASEPVLTLPSTEWEIGLGIELPLF